MVTRDRKTQRQRAFSKKQRNEERNVGRTGKFNQSNSFLESTIEMVVREEPEFWGDELLGCWSWLEEHESLSSWNQEASNQSTPRNVNGTPSLYNSRLELQKMLLEYDELSDRFVKHSQRFGI